LSYAPMYPGGDAVPAGPDAPHAMFHKGVPTVVAQSAMMKSYRLEKAAPTPATQADVMLIYTKDLAEKLGTGLMAALFNMVATVNQAYVDSEIAFSLRMVYALMLDYSNSNSSSDTLQSMANNGTQSAVFQTLTWGASSLRDTVGADFVALVRDGPTDTGGIGFLLANTAIYPSSNPVQTNAYSVVNQCIYACGGTLAHELGHNMGNHHDRATVGRDTNGAMNESGV